MALFTDFAIKSNYREFYHNQIETFKAKALVETMWTWLETNFPVKYDSLEILFSPLASSTPHNTISFAAKGQEFKEAFMFVEGPEPYYSGFPGKKAPGLFNITCTNNKKLMALHGRKEIDWKDNLYRDDKNNWGLAISIGDLSYGLIWETPTTDIELILDGNNYEVNLRIRYFSKKLKEWAVKIIEEKTKSNF
ncbi:MAG: hypothetical protein XE02_1444 [Mesotoga infera]|uniref:Uncharacterized protein n=1 Tax=Mesotoga infera TaxID=1236046 RepID=A0A101HZG3_9BACT|nr:MAG: hypothetical protein XE02_1444 [Mesotoga infera]